MYIIIFGQQPAVLCLSHSSRTLNRVFRLNQTTQLWPGSEHLNLQQDRQSIPSYKYEALLLAAECGSMLYEPAGIESATNPLSLAHAQRCRTLQSVPRLP